MLRALLVALCSTRPGCMNDDRCKMRWATLRTHSRLFQPHGRRYTDHDRSVRLCRSVYESNLAHFALDSDVMAVKIYGDDVAANEAALCT
jgi:hypothetical protein